MRLRPPRTTRTDTLFPVTSLFRSAIVDDRNGHRGTPFGPLPGARPGSTPAWPDRSERALGGGHGVGLARIDPDGLAKRAGQTLEAGLDDMVVVGAVEVLHVQRQAGDRKSVVSGKSVSGRVDLGGRRNNNKTNRAI